MGNSTKPEMQKDYKNTIEEIAKYYKKELNYKAVEIINENDFSIDGASGTIAFMGPVQAFKKLAVLNLPFEITAEGYLNIAGDVFDHTRTGFLIKNRTKTVMLLSGLSYTAFIDMLNFTPDDDSLKIVVDAMTYATGNYIGDKLTLRPLVFSNKYPTKSEVEGLEIPESSISLQAMSESKPLISQSDYTDLKWLEEKVKGKKVVFFGESHWSESVNSLALRMILFLADKCDLGSVLLEEQYSRTGFYQYYISLADDKKAEEFFSEYLNGLVACVPDECMLRTLRQWNMNHPDKRIRIGCNDMEWDVSRTINIILLPYFKKIDPEFKIDDSAINGDGVDLIKRFKEIMKIAKEKNITGDYPFITPAYMETVVASLESTYECMCAGENYSIPRQKAFIRNIVDSNFNGSAFDSSLVFIWGGGWHARKNDIGATEDIPDATYLNHSFEKTKGKLLTICVRYLTLNFKPVLGVDFNKYFESADIYCTLVKMFNKFYSLKKATLEDYYAIVDGGLSLFDHLMIELGYIKTFNIFRIEKIDWDALKKVYGDKLKDDKDELESFDEYVFILKSLIMKTRELPKSGVKIPRMSYSISKPYRDTSKIVQPKKIYLNRASE